MERYAATCGNPALAVFARMQARRIRADEARIAPRVERCLMITPHDEARLREIAPGARTAVVPGVIAAGGIPPVRPPGPGDDLLVVATGTFSFPPTGEGLVHFVEQVWPRVLAAAPHARFRVIGHCPESLRDRLAGRPGVEVLGRVESVEEHLDGAHVLVVPAARRERHADEDPRGDGLAGPGRDDLDRLRGHRRRERAARPGRRRTGGDGCGHPADRRGRDACRRPAPRGKEVRRGATTRWTAGLRRRRERLYRECIAGRAGSPAVASGHAAAP